jgi:uncharacterized protein (TIGR03435 family)
VKILSFVLLCGAAFAQEPKPSFEVVSIRPGSMNRATLIGSVTGGPGSADPERLFMNSVTPKVAVSLAYDVGEYQVSGPDWIGNSRYDINAKVPAGATKEQFRLMLQDVLDHRFRIKVHHEAQDFKAYHLVEAKGGLKLKDAVSTDACAAGNRPASKSCPPGAAYVSGIAQSAGNGPPMLTSSPAEGGFIVRGSAQTISSLADVLSWRMPGPGIIDQTGLTGTYDFRLEFANPDVGAQGDFSFPTLSTALEKELGLKLEPMMVSRDTIVIDRIDRPTEN